MDNKIKKLYELRKSLFIWEKEIGISELSEKSKIIFSFLLTVKKFPISINSVKENKVIVKSMSIASFNRAVKELILNKKIFLKPDPMDRRSQIVSSIKISEH